MRTIFISILFLIHEQGILSGSWLAGLKSGHNNIGTNVEDKPDSNDYGVDVSCPIHRYLDPNTYQVYNNIFKILNLSNKKNVWSLGSKV